MNGFLLLDLYLFFLNESEYLKILRKIVEIMFFYSNFLNGSTSTSSKSTKVFIVLAICPSNLVISINLVHRYIGWIHRYWWLFYVQIEGCIYCSWLVTVKIPLLVSSLILPSSNIRCVLSTTVLGGRPSQPTSITNLLLLNYLYPIARSPLY